MRYFLFILVLCFSINPVLSQNGNYLIDVTKDEHKVFYAGYDNWIIVPPKASVKVSGGVLSKNNDTSYILKVPGQLVGQSIEVVAVSGKMKWQRIMPVKVMPQPSLLLGTVVINGTISLNKTSFLNLSGQNLAMGYPKDTQIRFNKPLESFSIEVRVNGATRLNESVKGSKIPSSVIQLVKALSACEIVINNTKIPEQTVRLPEAKIQV